MKKVNIVLFIFFVLIFNQNLFAVSGSCGEDTYYDITDGCLTIVGQGDIISAPWNAERHNIIVVNIENGVRSIGNYVFDGFNHLREIHIPDDITITDKSFYGIPEFCTFYVSDAENFYDKLKQLNLPGSNWTIAGSSGEVKKFHKHHFTYSVSDNRIYYKCELKETDNNCDFPDDVYISIKKKLSEKELQLNVKINPENAEKSSVVWTSSDKKIAEVDETGLVRAKNPGKVIITATAKDVPEISDSASITVNQKF